MKRPKDRIKISLTLMAISLCLAAIGLASLVQPQFQCDSLCGSPKRLTIYKLLGSLFYISETPFKLETIPTKEFEQFKQDAEILNWQPEEPPLDLRYAASDADTLSFTAWKQHKTIMVNSLEDASPKGKLIKSLFKLCKLTYSYIPPA